MTKIVNLTPHAINITGGPTFAPSGEVARVEQNVVRARDINGIPVHGVSFGDIVGLPNLTDDTFFIVSAIVLAASKAVGRKDCIAPNSGDAVRNQAGHIVSVNGFVM